MYLYLHLLGSVTYCTILSTELHPFYYYFESFSPINHQFDPLKSNIWQTTRNILCFSMHHNSQHWIIAHIRNFLYAWLGCCHIICFYVYVFLFMFIVYDITFMVNVFVMLMYMYNGLFIYVTFYIKIFIMFMFLCLCLYVYV